MVYATAKPAVRVSIASAVAERARDERHRWFVVACPLRPGMTILDLGCGPLGLRAREPGLDITGVDVRPQPTYPGPFVRADATRPLPFADGQFDLVYSNSLIEHVAPVLRPALAAEIRRVALGWWVQTPAYSFPVEPHALLPAAHWLPATVRRWYWRLGVAGKWEDIALLRRRELLALFGPLVFAEWLGPVVKSWIAFRPPYGRPRSPSHGVIEG